MSDKKKVDNKTQVKTQTQTQSTPSEGLENFGANLNFATKEAYALLRANLSFSLLGKEGGKKIGVTSAVPQEGKSTVSINLAYSLAEAGNKVLLIDADLRRGSIGKKLKKRSSPGFSNFLAGDETSVVHTNVLIDGLDVIVRGDTPPNPAELLGSEKTEKVLNVLKDKYDYIVVDLPPVNSVVDPLVLSGYLDGFIIVLRHGFSRGDLVKETVHRLKFAKAHIFGFVYNAYSKTNKGYYKGYYRKKYSSYYRYYGSKKSSKHVNNDPSKEEIKEIKI